MTHTGNLDYNKTKNLERELNEIYNSRTKGI